VLRNDGEDDATNRSIGLPTTAIRTDRSALADLASNKENLNRGDDPRLLDV